MKLVDDTMTLGSVSGFAFSAVRPETLGSTEYTLVTVVMDKTGSVSSFAGELNKLKGTVVGACRKSPRAEFLLLRVVEFNRSVDEVHGFLPLNQVDVASYVAPTCEGLTALADATFAAVSATNAYAKTLAQQDYLVNGIVFIGTDGVDNDSRMRPADIQKEIVGALKGEHIESLRTVLIGINAAQYARELQAFQVEAGIDQYVDLADATPQRLAKLADFVSRSISAQSQSLGTGGPSQALVF
ncbi:hypothetical protein WDL1P1_00748 (plasmid) [Variovorax sp. WDL1]|nr:hypothetical protein APY03_0630 [Variovorax sp. WDL1]PNG49829.1 hypothetical protein CHC06_05410 [Variovorax sp. B2]PNG50701.1 hypothetical protein CHC07_05315 [Variovorax sp. B4]VTV17894.1 hypothetical protein WDL1P1_00748 [Variovorax sp. WDL1]